MMAMKSESPDEARKRLEALSEAEKRGAAAASEGQLQPIRDAAGGDVAGDAVTFTGPRPAAKTAQETETATVDERQGVKRKTGKR